MVRHFGANGWGGVPGRHLVGSVSLMVGSDESVTATGALGAVAAILVGHQYAADGRICSPHQGSRPFEAE